MAPVRLNGKPGHLLIDTGAGISCVDPAKDLTFGFRPLKGAIIPINGGRHGITQMTSLGIGPVEIRNLKMALVGMGASNRTRGEGDRVDGILGLDALRAGRAVIDCQQLRLYWKAIPTAPNVMASSLRKAGWTAVKLDVKGNHYFAAGTVNQMPARFMIDTGAFATFVDRSFAAKAGLAENGQRFHRVGVHNEDSNSHVARPSGLKIGAFALKDFPVGVTGLGMVRSLDRSTSAVLGADALGRNLGVIDCEENILYLKSPNGR